MTRETPWPRTLPLLRRVTPAGTKRRPRVVRHLARPHELPERGKRRLGVELGRSEQVEPELGAPPERFADPVVRLAFRRRRRGGRAECGGVLTEVDGDAVEAGAGPHDLAGSAEL